MKKKVVISIVLVIVSIISIFGVTYSYFTNKMVGEAGKINVKVADGIISISETEISISNAVPILDETKETKASINEFNITLNEEASVCYSIELVVDKIGENLKNKWFKYELINEDNEKVEGTFESSSNGARIPLLDSQELNGKSESNNYTLRIWLSYDLEEDQTSILQGSSESRTFTGHLHASGEYGRCKAKVLSEIINANNNKYIGESKNNYIQYPENSNKEENLWRIIGNYEEGIKIISEKEEETSISNIQTKLNKIYESLTKKEDYINETNKFNCTSSGCDTSSYNNIGLISTYEYELVGGLNSYLRPKNSYYALDNPTIKNITINGIEETNETTSSGIKASVYLQREVKVVGKGTKSNPYILVPRDDEEYTVSIVGENINVTTDTSVTVKRHSEARFTVKAAEGYGIDTIECDGGSEGIYTNGEIIVSDVIKTQTCTVTTKELKTLYATLTDGVNYPKVYTRTTDSVDSEELKTGIGFNNVASEAMNGTTGVIYLESGKENGFTEDEKDVYYFAGNPKDNWVLFAGFYWRIIRTNEDGSVRLLYAGTKHDATDAYIAKSTYSINSSTYNNTMYVGWKYGTSGSLANNRNGNNEGAAKTALDKWYEDNIEKKGYGDKVSKEAIYCNDRATSSYSASSAMYYAAYNRLRTNKRPSYKCGVKADGTMYSNADNVDKFTSKEASVGNKKLKYPVGLMTADEVAFAGGKYNTSSPNTYYYLNSAGDPVTGSTYWWTMSPFYFDYGSAYVFYVNGSGNPGYLYGHYVYYTFGLRPVVSLDSGTLISGGKGTSSEPYLILSN